MRNVKSDDSSAFRGDFGLCGVSGVSDPPRTLCGRLRTLCEHNATTSRRLWNFKTGTLLLRIREKEKGPQAWERPETPTGVKET